MIFYITSYANEKELYEIIVTLLLNRTLRACLVSFQVEKKVV